MKNASTLIRRYRRASRSLSRYMGRARRGVIMAEISGPDAPIRSVDALRSLDVKRGQPPWGDGSEFRQQAHGCAARVSDTIGSETVQAELKDHDKVRRRLRRSVLTDANIDTVSMATDTLRQSAGVDPTEAHRAWSAASRPSSPSPVPGRRVVYGADKEPFEPSYSILADIHRRLASSSRLAQHDRQPHGPHTVGHRPVKRECQARLLLAAAT